MLGALRSGAWLDGGRAPAYRTIFASLFLSALPFIWIFHVAGVALPPILPGGRAPVDFVTFYCAAKLAALHTGTGYYDVATLAAHESQTVVLESTQFQSFFYPPPYLVIIYPLALFSYLPGFAIWVGGQTALLGLGIRRLWPRGLNPLTMAGFAPLFINSFVGQNGTLSAALYLLAARYIDTSPFFAGMFLGLFAGKPQLAMAVPLALLAAGRMRALAGAAFSAAALAAAATALFGRGVWQAYADLAPIITQAMIVHSEDWWRYLSVQTAMRELGLSFEAASLAQAIVSVLAIGAAALVAWRRPCGTGLLAVAAVASAIATPHLSDYDLSVLVLPLLVLFRVGQTRGWQPWEKSAGAALFAVPMIARWLSAHGLPIMPPLLCAFLYLLAKRVAQTTIPGMPVGRMPGPETGAYSDGTPAIGKAPAR